MSDWYIMSARSIQAKMDFTDVIEHLSPNVIFVVERVKSINRTTFEPNIQQSFVVGAGTVEGYKVAVGDTPRYMIDTGSSYKSPITPTLLIVNTININKDGSFTAQNQIGFNKKLPTWVFK